MSNLAAQKIVIVVIPALKGLAVDGFHYVRTTANLINENLIAAIVIDFLRLRKLIAALDPFANF